MDKRLLLLGFICLIICFAIAYSVVDSVQNKISNSTACEGTSIALCSSQIITVAPYRMVYKTINMNTSGVLEAGYSSGNTPIDFYIMNQSAYSYLSQNTGSVNLNITDVASVEGNGLIFAVERHLSLFPYSSAYNSSVVAAPLYSVNESQFLSAGDYYLIFKNPTNESVNATYIYAVSNTGLINFQNPLAASGSEGGIASAAFLIAGIILIVLGLVYKKVDKVSEVKLEEEIEKEYARIDKKAAKKKPATVSQKRKNRRKK